jgi:predicted S18 family serine protease
MTERVKQASDNETSEKPISFTRQNFVKTQTTEQCNRTFTHHFSILGSGLTLALNVHLMH